MKTTCAALFLTVAAFATAAHAQWTLVAEFTSPGSGDTVSFGGSMALQGNRLMVAGYGFSIPAGVYPYTRVGGQWTAEPMLSPDGDAGPITPGRVALEGDNLFVSDNSFDQPREDAGIVYRYSMDGGVWTFIESIVPASGARYEQFFGSALDADGERLLVGAVWDRKYAPKQGAAFVYENVGGSYQQTARLEASDGSEGDSFGRECAIDGDTAVVFAPNDVQSDAFWGSLYVFEHDGQAWSQAAKIVQPAQAENRNEDFGDSIALEGNTLVVGAPAANGNMGRVYVYERVGGVWQLVQTLVSPSPFPFSDFGARLALSGDRLVVGAPEETFDTGGDDRRQGAVYVFTRENGVWSAGELVLAGEPVNAANYGSTVVIDGATFAAATDTFSPEVVSVFETDSPCVADWNEDGGVDTQDVLAYLNAWVAEEAEADVTGDGEVDTQDLLLFLNLWTVGC